MVVKGAGGESGVRNTKVGKDNNDRNDNTKVVVKVGQDNICKIQLFQCTVRAGVWPLLYKPTLILFPVKYSGSISNFATGS